MIASPIRLLSQDSDSIYTKYLISFSYTFDLINGQLEGTGGEILEAAITDTDMLLLGNNTRDKMESDLSLTLAQLLNNNGYKHLLMETGPESANQVIKTSQTSDLTTITFKKLNRQYGFQRKDLVYTPIPDFKNIEAAEFIDFLHEENWSIGGFGTESWTSYKMLSDAMYHRIPPHNQDAYKDLYVQSMTLLDSSVRLSRHRFVKIKRAISNIIKNAIYGRNEFRKK